MLFGSAHPFQLDRRALATLVLAGLLILLAGLLALFVQGGLPWQTLSEGPLTSPIRWELLELIA
jgi:hypothetical protein